MQTRVRHIVHKRKGTVVQNEQLFDKSVITIGRSTDQDIFLSDLGVAYRHARLTISANGQVGISSLSNAGIYVNGR
ncbi:MAG: FHA domain-containing protein, partial [Gammaproteobacteria bacterium]